MIHLTRNDCVNCAEGKKRRWSDGDESSELWCPHFKKYLTNYSNGSVTPHDLIRLPECVDYCKSQKNKNDA